MLKRRLAMIGVAGALAFATLTGSAFAATPAPDPVKVVCRTPDGKVVSLTKVGRAKLAKAHVVAERVGPVDAVATVPGGEKGEAEVTIEDDESVEAVPALPAIPGKHAHKVKIKGGKHVTIACLRKR
ncbi:hypothetical protein [Nonomuraea pusilla]|uniref:Uncharacterized protein n=1 Tax=Nonomuraea pusilla TaxID=46177 RepID=A0A1H8EXD3_9ACTN|nr:hypothetical protein [Nonomuraea pusilla]SEN24142.1 hypothetical protein SAMN05660976_07145 [Nonomuraea pusilla]